MANQRIKIRRDTKANWTTKNSVLAAGEPALETDTRRIKYGDGLTPWNDLEYDSLSNPTMVSVGSRTDPNVIASTTGITASRLREIQFVKSDGGPVLITADPQVSAGILVGQELILKGTNDTDFVTLLNGLGLELNGPCTLKNKSQLHLMWDGTIWGEVARNGY